MSGPHDNYAPKISLAEIRDNFGDIAPALSAQEAVLEASRCLYCYDAPCTRACPTHIDVPRFIQQIGSGDVTGSAKTIFTENILGGACARVCPTSVLCEGACVYNALNKKPIEIGRLQRHATDFATARDLQFWKKGKTSGKRVAIVGSGPAGLSCAHELTKLGHTCVVFEREILPGGLNTFGIAGYKITADFAAREVEYVKKIGFEIKTGVTVGEKPTLAELLKEYDAVYLGVGMADTAALSIPGEELQGCLEALEFIKPTRHPEYRGCQVGRNVLVVGGGNTAIDAATAAVRLGARQVTIVYRRTEKEMPAFKYEYELAKADGVRFVWLTAPVRIIGKNGLVTGMECEKLELSAGEGRRAALKAVPGSSHLMECDMVIKALGQNPHAELLKGISGLKLKDGAVSVDSENYATSVPGLFSGGDCIAVGEVVDAVEHGKKSARGINRFLSTVRSNG